MKILKIILIFTIFLILSCGKTDLIYDPFPDGALHKWSGKWVIYGDKLQTGGGIQLFDSWEEQSFEDSEENPYSGKKCLKYSWTGNPVYSYVQGTKVGWCGMIFLVGGDWQYQYTKNISGGQYNV